jgi:hypothetical protein
MRCQPFQNFADRNVIGGDLGSDVPILYHQVCRESLIINTTLGKSTCDDEGIPKPRRMMVTRSTAIQWYLVVCV